jgi:hypothetical protein
VDSPCDATQPHTDGVRRNEFPQSWKEFEFQIARNGSGDIAV